MTIHLFGDSYVENESAENLRVKDHKRWYDLLSEECNEENINYGKCGEGPAETMQKFRNVYEKGDIKKEDKVVIVLSHPMRIPWTWTGDSASCYTMFFGHTKENKLDVYQEYAIGSLYDCMWDELSFMNYYRLTFLKTILKVPTVCFTVYDINTNHKDTIYNKHLYDLNLNTGTFYYYNTPLDEHSHNEFSKDKNNYRPPNDGKINHLTEVNHHVLKNIISNHFYDTNYSTEFITNNFKDVAYIESNHNADFVYE